MTTQEAIDVLSELLFKTDTDDLQEFRRINEGLILGIFALKSKLSEGRARVLDIEEIMRLPKDTDLFIEMSHGIGMPTTLFAVTKSSEIDNFGKSTGVAFYGTSPDYKTYNNAVYGWRCWNKRPTQLQKVQTKWENKSEVQYGPYSRLE